MKLLPRQFPCFATAAAMLLMAMWPAAAQTAWPDQRDGDVVLKNFGFGSGEVLPEL